MLLPDLERRVLNALRQARPSTADMRAAMPELKAAFRKHDSGPLYFA